MSHMTQDLESWIKILAIAYHAAPKDNVKDRRQVVGFRQAHIFKSWKAVGQPNTMLHRGAVASAERFVSLLHTKFRAPPSILFLSCVEVKNEFRALSFAPADCVAQGRDFSPYSTLMFIVTYISRL
jgi:hypothetical protein